MRTRLAASSGAVLLLAAAGIAASTQASAGVLPPKTSFTVVTSFVDQPSEIIDATGPWSDCTGVLDLSNVVNQVSPTKIRFSGEKRVLCESGDVDIRYDAELNTAATGRTFGTWSVVSSTKPDIMGGAGTVSGVSRGCEDCIVDTFTGRVY